MNLVGAKFFLMGGVVLIVSGLLQLLVRPRNPKEKGLARVVNASTMRLLVFVSVGTLAVLVGTGYVPLASLRF